MDTAVLGKLGDGNGSAPAEKFIPWKKRGLSESPVDFGSQQDGTWDEPEVKRQRTEVGEVVGEEVGEVVVGEEEQVVGAVVGRGSGVENDVGNPIVGEEVGFVLVVTCHLILSLRFAKR